MFSHLDNQKRKTRSTASCGHGSSLPERVWQRACGRCPALHLALPGATLVSITVSHVCWPPSPRTRPWYLMCKPGFCSVGMPRLLRKGIAVTLSSCHHCCERGLHPAACSLQPACAPSPSAVPAVSFWSQISGSPVFNFVTIVRKYKCQCHHARKHTHLCTSIL